MSDVPLPSSFDENADFYNESGLEKVWRKVKREPLIPLGCALTVTAFVNAWRAMRKGDHHQVQRMFRARVYAQGFTIVAIMAGGMYFGAERQKERELWKIQAAQDSEEKRLRWIQELEARDAEDKALKERVAKRRTQRAEAAAEPPAESRSILEAARAGWLGGRKATAEAAQAAEEAKAEKAKAEEAKAAEAKAEIAKAEKAKAEEAALPAPETVSAAAKEPPKRGGRSSLDTLGGLFSKNSAVADKADEDAKK